MPVENIVMSDVIAAAKAGYTEDVKKALQKKYKVIAKRQSQVDGFVAGWNETVKEFEDALAAATTPAQIMETIEAHKFPASVIHFTPKQEWTKGNSKQDD